MHIKYLITFMKNRLEEKLSKSVTEFRDKVYTEIRPGKREISGPGDFNNKELEIESVDDLKKPLNTVCPKNIHKFKNTLTEHYNEMKGYISLASSPQAFKTAWDLKSSKLNSLDLEDIVSMGGQIIPFNENTKVLYYGERGVIMGPGSRLILGVRHSEGNYKDDLDDLGRFEYQPPANKTGVLRYRFLQHLSNRLEIDLIVLVIMWVKYEISDSINHVFLLSPAKVIDYSKDLKDLNESIQNPLTLQLIHRSEAYSKIGLLNALDLDDSEIDSRSELSLSLARGFSYDKLNSTTKGINIKEWAQKTNKKCPGHECGIPFSELNKNEIAFGHIISQKWSLAFPHLQSKKDHPDNLYLTCNRCNSSLSEYFPDNNLRNRILKVGTIGDWLRHNEKDIMD